VGPLTDCFAVVEDLYLPVMEPHEIESVLEGLPLVVDVPLFVDFVKGFPRRYLSQTPKLEIVKHFLLATNLGDKRVITSLAEQPRRWKLSVITRDRSFLFARISGALSCFKMNILEAEAFANAHGVVLDTLYFEDLEQSFRGETERQAFQVLLEDIVSGDRELEPVLEQRWPDIASWEDEHVEVGFDNQAFPRATVMQVRCRDRFGLLYLISHFLSEAGFSIEMAYIRTEHHEADDEFYLTREGRKLVKTELEELTEAFSSFPVPQFRE
jgi:[protein-PII] uridylyltransferase